MSAQEAKSFGFVSEVYPHVAFEDELMTKAMEIAKLSQESLKITKTLTRGHEREHLRNISRQECDLLIERWTSKECFQAIMQFMNRKKK